MKKTILVFFELEFLPIQVSQQVASDTLNAKNNVFGVTNMQQLWGLIH
jgi:hypothetical protein